MEAPKGSKIKRIGDGHTTGDILQITTANEYNGPDGDWISFENSKGYIEEWCVDILEPRQIFVGGVEMLLPLYLLGERKY